MSQRGRPGSAQMISEWQRMPFEAAEALLWGKKTHHDHLLLFPRIKELEDQHQAYNARIQATEAVAEAAEAATSRVRRIEQQIAAIESDEQDRPFDKWVEGEITGFKGFMEQNKTVRQKQIELETKISDLEDAVDKGKDASRDVEILLDRIGRLESDRMKDADQIKKLERDILNLTSVRSNQAMRKEDLQTVTTRMAIPEQIAPPLPIQVNLEASDTAEETENEEILPSFRTNKSERELIQVPQSPAMISKSTSTILPFSSAKERGNMSARLRVMQRKSFYEPKQSREDKQRQLLVPALASNPISRPRPDSPPPTQIISRTGAVKPVPATKTRTPDQMPDKKLIVKLCTKKRKIEDVVPSIRLTRSQAKKNNESVLAQSRVPPSKEVNSTVKTQVSEPAAKRRKPNTNRAPLQVPPQANQMSNAANLVKMSPRKAAMETKRGEPVDNPVQPPTQLLPNPRTKQTVNTDAVSCSTKPHGRRGAYPKDAGSSKLKTSKQEKPSTTSATAIHDNSSLVALEGGTTATSSKVKPPASRPGSNAQRGLQRPPLAMPVTFDSVTYEEMKRKGEFII